MGIAETIATVVAGPPPLRSGWGGVMDTIYQATAGDGGSGGRSPGRVTTVAAAQRVLSQLGSTLPVKIVQRGDKSRKSVQREEHRFLWGRPNPAMNQKTYWSQQFRSSLARGNPYGWKGRREGVRVNPDKPWEGIEQLWPLHPNDVRIVKGPNLEKLFIINGDREHPVSTAEVAHTPYATEDGFVGISPIEQHAGTLGLTLEAQRQEMLLLRRGLRTPGVLTSELLITNDDAKAIVERWVENQTGQNQNPIVLGKGAKFDPITVSPQDAQLLELLGHTREEELMIYGITPQILGLVTKTTSWGTGVEQLFIQFVVTVLLPFLIPFEQTYSDECLPPELEMKFSVNALLRGDMNARANFYRTLRMIGVMSADAILELEDMPARGIPDDYLTPTNMQRLMADGGRAVGPQPVAAPTVLAPAAVLAEARCECGALLGKNVSRADLWCARCKVSRSFGDAPVSEAESLRGPVMGVDRDVQDFWERVGDKMAERMIA